MNESLSAESVLRTIVEGVEAETGEPFFTSLVRHLAVALEVPYVFVSALSLDLVASDRGQRRTDEIPQSLPQARNVHR